MSKVALAASIGLLLFFTYLTGFKVPDTVASALCLLFAIAWAWPRSAIRGMSLTRKLDPGTPTVGESYEETIEGRRRGGGPGPWVEAAARSALPNSPTQRV